MSRILTSFVIGGLLGAAVMGVVCVLTPGISVFERAPEQISFDSAAWLSGDARVIRVIRGSTAGRGLAAPRITHELLESRMGGRPSGSNLDVVRRDLAIN
jgi:hypothetical protein